jgi:hypothetical protein
MSTQVQYRRGTQAQNDAFTGALGEMTIDTTNGTMRVHNGVTAGGSNIATVAYVSSAISASTPTQIISGATLVGIASSNANITMNVAGTTITRITTAGIENGQANGTGNIGNASTYFNTLFATATKALYADLAEMYTADKVYEPGTVVEFGGEFEVTASANSHTPTVAGVVSTNPSYLMNATLHGDNVVPVALTGRVPCQVIGTIRKGDRLVASDITGVAAPLDMSLYQPGCIIGKALQNYDSTEVGTIEVAVGRD